jgi:outer membrane lipoprotein-sorting protein
MHIDFAGKAQKLLLVSDGSKLTSIQDGMPHSPLETPKFLRDTLTALTARAGVFVGLMVTGKSTGNNNQKNPLDEIKVSGFKALPNEQVNGRDAAVIAYQIALPDNQTASATVWIDTATNLPLKRTLRTNLGGVGMFTETYRDIRLNPPLDARLFELPNAKGEAK